MKRTLTAALALLLLLTGCGSRSKTVPTSATEPTTEELVTVTEAATAPPRPIAERAASLQAAGDTYIFDEQGVLTDEEKQQYNDYLGWLCSSRQIKAAAVITDALGGTSPEEFAKRYYETLFGTHEPGFLVLVNNDTNKDYIYCAGSCAAYLGDTAPAIARATPFLVEKNYADALEILLPVGEQLSDRIFDRCGALTAEQSRTLDVLSAASEQRICVLLINALPGEEPPETTAAPETEVPSETEVPAETDAASETEEASETEVPAETNAAVSEVPEELKSYAEDIRKQTEADTLLVIDTAGRTAWIAGNTEALPAVQEALSGGDVYSAASAMFS